MLALIQRVSSASVKVDGHDIAAIDDGLVVLLGVEKGDNRQSADALLKKVLAYRVFADAEGRMNLSVMDTGGSLLVVSQFTLVADTNRGLRPSFSSAKSPDEAQALYEYFVREAEKLHPQKVECGRFAADMQVSLVNDGPVTFILRS